MENFGKLFKYFRLQSQIKSLSKFADFLADEGVIYETSMISKWQTNRRMPKNRETMLAILAVFIKKGGINSSSQANYFLESAGFGLLTHREIVQLFKDS